MKIRGIPITYPDNTFFIYKITCKQNNKAYVGLTKNPHKRFEEHLSGQGSKPLLHDLVNFGIKQFNFEIIDILINTPKEQAEARERELILLHDCIRNGYNISLGAITANDDEIDINNIEIDCKNVHEGVFTCSEHTHSLSYQKLTNLKDRFLYIENLKKKKHYGYNYYQIELDECGIINNEYTFILKLENGVLGGATTLRV